MAETTSTPAALGRLLSGSRLADLTLTIAENLPCWWPTHAARQVGRECVLAEVCLADKEPEATVDQGVGHDGTVREHHHGAAVVDHGDGGGVAIAVVPMVLVVVMAMVAVVPASGR